MGRYNRRAHASIEEFFTLNTGKRSEKELAEYSYLLIHTLYLKEGIKIKPEMGKRWEEYLGVYMSNETFEYMVVNEPVLVRDAIVNEIRQGKEITSTKYLYKTIVALEFDLWMIERYQKHLVLNAEEFDAYLHRKYGEFFDAQYASFIKYDLLHIKNLNVLAEKLVPYYNKISNFLNQIINVNKMRIHIERYYLKRTVNYRNDLSDSESESEKKPLEAESIKKASEIEDAKAISETKSADEASKTENGSEQILSPVENKESCSSLPDNKTEGKIQDDHNDHKSELTIRTKEEIKVRNDKTAAKNEEIAAKNEEIAAKNEEIPAKNQELLSELASLKSSLHEYEIILREREKRMEMLEQDIKEFKRQRDEAREYSVNQYDKGIRDFFAVMNDVRYGKIVDYLYFRLNTEDTDEILFSYLDNLFMALEDMEIEPIQQEDTVSVKEENLTKAYNLEFNKAEFDSSRVKVKYRGWKYKDVILEKPTLELKE